MVCAYCNKEKGNLEYTDEDGWWNICENCYEREILKKCHMCYERVKPDEMDYNFITLDDGLYYGEVEWLLGSINKEKIKKIDNGDFESYVHGICTECASIYEKDSVTADMV